MKVLFPTKRSTVGFTLMMVSICFLCATLLLLPAISAEVGNEFAQPKVANSLALVGFLGGMTLYGLERIKADKSVE